MPADRDVLVRRGRLNALQRYRPADDPVVVDARRDLAAESLARYVEKVVAEAPPLTPEQRDRIASLLRPATGQPEHRAAG